MGLMDKISSGVHKVADKTSDAIDIGVIRGKIGDETRNIEKRTEEIGQFYVKKYDDGGKVDTEAKSMFDAIDESRKKIAEYEKQIADIKAAGGKEEGDGEK